MLQTKEHAPTPSPSAIPLDSQLSPSRILKVRHPSSFVRSLELGETSFLATIKAS